jgi:hypothetical protein
MPGSGTRTFLDPDHYEASLRQAQIELVITSRGSFRARFTWAELHHLQLLRCEEDFPRIGYVSLAPRNQVVNSQTKQIGHLNEELSTVRAQATELEVRAQNAERGVSDTYDFNGAHRQTVSGRSMITVGGETVVFRTIIDLYNAKKWDELENECERQIRATPKWLTPYLYSGIAYVNRGVFDRAKERLEFVVKHSGNDPDYSDAARILCEIKSAAQR